MEILSRYGALCLINQARIGELGMTRGNGNLHNTDLYEHLLRLRLLPISHPRDLDRCHLFPSSM